MLETALHERFMRQAIELAATNPKAPFAALLVHRGTQEILATGINRHEQNPTFHGEIEAINQLAASRPNMNWTQLRLYTTAEPCCMCQGAILWAGIAEVVYGTSIQTLKRLGWKQIDISADEVTRRAGFADCRLIGGILQAECDRLFADAIQAEL